MRPEPLFRYASAQPCTAAVCLLGLLLQMACSGRALQLEGPAPADEFSDEQLAATPNARPGQRLLLPDPMTLGDWSCVTGPSPPTVQAETGPFVTLSLPLRSFADPYHPLAVPEGLSIAVCPVLDVICLAPPDTGGWCPTCPPIAIDANALGVSARVAVPYGFDGFIRITSPGHLDLHVHLALPSTFDRGFEPLDLLREQDVTDLFERYSQGQRFDAESGLVAVHALDCQLQPAAGVQIRVNPTDKLPLAFALQNGIPVFNPAPPARGSGTSVDSEFVTGSDGTVWFANVPARTMQFIAQVEGREAGTMELGILPGGLTVAEIIPIGALTAGTEP